MLVAVLALAGACLGAQPGLRELNVDVSAAGILPVTWAADGPSLAHRGYEALLGLEYDSPQSLPFRFEVGFVNASPSYISSSGELYRGWYGLRFAALGGYNFESIRLRGLGELMPSLLAGGAITSAVYARTALAYAYPSIVLEPRLCLRLDPIRPRSRAAAQDPAQGPWMALPMELMFRAGIHSFAPGLSLGWRYRLGAQK